MNTKNRKTKQLHISISEEDLAVINSFSKRTAMNRSEYIRNAVLNYPFEIPPIPTEALALICRVSTTLTQNNKLDPSQTKQLKKEVDSLWRLLKQ